MQEESCTSLRALWLLLMLLQDAVGKACFTWESTLTTLLGRNECVGCGSDVA